MTKIAVAGATGIIGKVIVAEAEKAGHEVLEISRAKGVNLLTGDGLDAALAGVEAVIDTSQVVNPVADDPITPIIDATKVLTAAAEKQGVKRLAMLSINGVEKPQLQEFPFYKVRFEQEGIFADSSVESVVVRSVQWFEFALNPAGSEVTDAEIKAQNWAIQPAAMDSVATFLVEAAEGKHGSGIVTVAGVERLTLPELTQRVLDSKSDTRKVTTVPAVLPALEDGSLFAPESAIILEPSLDEWLKTN